MRNFNHGVYVRHKTRFLNGGVPMAVIAIKGPKAKCCLFESSEMIRREVWFDFDELEIVNFGNL